MLDRLIIFAIFVVLVFGGGFLCWQTGVILNQSNEQVIQATRNADWVNANTTKVVSEAHENDAQATAIISVGFAESTAIVADSNQGPINAYKEGQQDQIEHQEDVDNAYQDGQTDAGRTLLIYVVAGAVCLLAGFFILGTR